MHPLLAHWRGNPYFPAAFGGAMLRIAWERILTGASALRMTQAILRRCDQLSASIVLHNWVVVGADPYNMHRTIRRGRPPGRPAECSTIHVTGNSLGL